MYIYRLLSFFVLLLQFSSANTSEDLKNCALSMLLPINHIDNNRITLAIDIPTTHKCLQFEGDKFALLPMLEFVPKHESGSAWSEIITSHTIVGKQISSKQFIEAIKGTFMKAATNIKILEQNTITNGQYEESLIAISYMYKGREEVVLIKCFSGSMDLACIQIVNSKEEKESAEATYNKLKTKMSNIARVINLKLDKNA